LGRDISPAECGGQRQSRLACPENCPHNPFGPANYSQLLEIEERLDRKTMEALVAVGPDGASIRRDLARAERQGAHAIHALFAWNLFFATGADQTTFAKRWEQSGLTELKNDERVLLRGKIQMRIALLEIHRVFDGGRVEAVDLLSPDQVPMIFQDRSMAATAARFSTLLFWIFPLPHYWRLSGTATAIPDVPDFSASEIVRETVRHLGGPLTEPEMRRWLAEHFVEFDNALRTIARLRRRLMFAGMDAKFGKAVYDLSASFLECRERLDALPEVKPDDLSETEEDEGFAEARVWFDHPQERNQLALPGGKPVLGRILLGQSSWRLETLGSDKLSRLRRQFEKHLGDGVRFSRERVDDLGAQMDDSGADAVLDETLAPPRLLENPEKILMASSRLPALPPGVSPEEAENQWMRAAERAFLDENVPALSGRTPREAARDPALRPKLVRLMKQRVRRHDERNLETGRTEDINWLLRELNLQELIFDAPPWRPPTATRLAASSAGLSEPLDVEESYGVDLSNRPPPPLPDVPLDLEEAIERLHDRLQLFDTAAEAEEELLASGATILDDAEELTLDLLTEEDFCIAIPFLLQAWFALVPPGCRAPEINFANLEKTFASNLRQIEACTRAGTPKKLESFFLSGSQPGLMLALMGGFLEAAQTVPKEFRPAPVTQPVILALLKSVLEELNEALRLK
jgi:hypothetical protein